MPRHTRRSHLGECCPHTAPSSAFRTAEAPADRHHNLAKTLQALLRVYLDMGKRQWPRALATPSPSVLFLPPPPPSVVGKTSLLRGPLQVRFPPGLATVCRRAGHFDAQWREEKR